MKKILFITSQYRVGERIYPIIPFLAKKYELHLLKVYQMDPTHRWVGNNDLRISFDKNYLQFFSKVFYRTCSNRGYDLILSDDNRLTLKTGLNKIYRSKTCLMIGCTHGNGDNPYLIEGYKTVFDKCFVFGNEDKKYDYCIPVGIPSNDSLRLYKDLEKKHILILINFLGNRNSPFKVNFDKNFFKLIDIQSLQNTFNLPILLKLKSRDDEGGYRHNVEYLQKNLPSDLIYDIIVDVEDDNKLIGESACVISAPSTMAFKPIQLGIPTVLIKDSGQVSCFAKYTGLLSLQDNIIKYIQDYKYQAEFLKNTLAGGVDFSSTQIMVSKIDELLYEEN